VDRGERFRAQIESAKEARAQEQRERHLAQAAIKKTAAYAAKTERDQARIGTKPEELWGTEAGELCRSFLKLMQDFDYPKATLFVEIQKEKYFIPRKWLPVMNHKAHEKEVFRSYAYRVGFTNVQPEYRGLGETLESIPYDRDRAHDVYLCDDGMLRHFNHYERTGDMAVKGYLLDVGRKRSDNFRRILSDIPIDDFGNKLPVYPGSIEIKQRTVIAGTTKEGAPVYGLQNYEAIVPTDLERLLLDIALSAT
jgi:hypothetical protein